MQQAALRLQHTWLFLQPDSLCILGLGCSKTTFPSLMASIATVPVACLACRRQLPGLCCYRRYILQHVTRQQQGVRWGSGHVPKHVVLFDALCARSV